MPTLLATENVTKQDRLCHRGREEEEEEEEEQQQQQQQQENTSLTASGMKVEAQERVGPRVLGVHASFSYRCLLTR